jgi:hypothetical protein
MSQRREWFAPKRYGIGAGVPIAWQGWAALALFGAALVVALLLFGADDPRGGAIILPAAAVLVIVSALTTKDGWRWRWRWGKED